MIFRLFHGLQQGFSGHHHDTSWCCDQPRVKSQTGGKHVGFLYTNWWNGDPLWGPWCASSHHIAAIIVDSGSDILNSHVRPWICWVTHHSQLPWGNGKWWWIDGATIIKAPYAAFFLNRHHWSRGFITILLSYTVKNTTSTSCLTPNQGDAQL